MQVATETEPMHPSSRGGGQFKRTRRLWVGSAGLGATPSSGVGWVSLVDHKQRGQVLMGVAGSVIHETARSGGK
jgi:hypothetical protein